MEKSGDNIVNLGGDKLNINTTTAKGLEKVIGIIASFIIKSQDSTNKIIYGDPRKKFKNKTNNKGDVNQALNNGLLYVVDTLASVDLCNIINYALQQIPGGQPFDPTKPPPTDSVVERSKWTLQKAAYDTQIFIDKYYNMYADSNNIQSRIGLSDLVTQVSISLQEITSAVSQESANPVLLKSYSELSVLNNFIDNAVGYFNKYTEVRSIPVDEVQKIISYIDKTRNVCIAIQGINSPATLINFADSTFNIGIQEQIKRVEKIINPARLIPLLKSILKTANNINSIGRKVLGYITTARAIIRIAVLLLKVFKIIIKFLKALPIPSIFVTVGIQNIISDTLQEKVNKFVDKTVNRLNQINAVLTLIVIFVTNLLVAIDRIIQALKLMLMNLDACNNTDPDLIRDLNDTIDNLNGTRNDLQTFIDTYNNNANQVNKKFGKYTIEIITEQVTDEGINLKRRYGVGISPENTVVVQSTPTFASLDQIIINEVKVLLVSNGFVDSDLQSLTADQIQVLTESLNYLEEGDINIQEIETSISQANFNNEADTEIKLTQFVDNLAGGKALRKRVRKKMIKQNEVLVSELKESDPNGTYTSSVIKEKQNETNKLKIEDLEDQKKKLLATLAISVGNPVITAITIKKIKDIDIQINKLKNS
jgi:hypothetical protein